MGASWSARCPEVSAPTRGCRPCHATGQSRARWTHHEPFAPASWDVMIAILGRTTPPDESLARRALAAVPYAVPIVQFRRLGACLLGIAEQPDLPDASISADGTLIAALDGRLDNAVELHQECVAAGATPASTSDADVVVAA